MTKIFLVRHGQSLGNTVATFNGSIDTPLTDLGKEQAQALIEFFKDKEIDKIYSSDLSRAFDTITPVAQLKGLSIIKDKRLREIHGGKWEGIEYSKLPELFPEDFWLWTNDPSKCRCTGGESSLEVTQRAYNALCDIAKNSSNAIVATHGFLTRALYTYLRDGDIKDLKNTGYLPNAAIMVWEYADGKFAVNPKVHTQHLGDMITQLPVSLV